MTVPITHKTEREIFSNGRYNCTLVAVECSCGFKHPVSLDFELMTNRSWCGCGLTHPIHRRKDGTCYVICWY